MNDDRDLTAGFESAVICFNSDRAGTALLCGHDTFAADSSDLGVGALPCDALVRRIVRFDCGGQLQCFAKIDICLCRRYGYACDRLNDSQFNLHFVCRTIQLI